MKSLNTGSLPVTVSYLAMSGAGFEAANNAVGQDRPYKWDVAPRPQLQVVAGLHVAPPSPPYIMRASEEASFTKVFRRSPRVISTGELR